MNEYRVDFWTDGGLQSFIVDGRNRIDAIHKAWQNRIPGSFAYGEELTRVDISKRGLGK